MSIFTPPTANLETSDRPRRRWRSLLPAAYFLTLTGTIAYPWFLRSGFLFLLDFSWTPTLLLPESLRTRGFISSYPHEWLFWVLSHIVPTDLVQKTVFSSVFFLAGLSLYQLVRWLLRTKDPVVRELAALTAGTFYAVNPFVILYAVAGITYHLLGYALTPWAVLTILKFLDRPRTGSGLLAGTTAVLVVLSNAHHAILLSLALTPLVFDRRIFRISRRALLAFSVPLLLFAAISLFLVFQSTTRLSALDAQGPWTRTLKAPLSDNLIVDVLALTARWPAEVQTAQPQELLPFFGILVAALLATMATGIIGFWRTQDTGPLVRRLVLVLAVAAVLAIGVAHQATAPVAGWLYRHVPFWMGMRDSSKFLALIPLVEGIFLGLGVAWLAAWAERPLRIPRPFVLLRQMLPATVFAVTVFLATPAFDGFQDQFRPLHYPQSWTEWNARLAAEPKRPHTDRPPPADEASRNKPRMLFLPWYAYPILAFTERAIANPAPAFFTNAEVVSSDVVVVDPRDGSATTERSSRDPSLQRIGALLRDHSLTTLGARLAEERIRYVALTLDSPDGERLKTFLLRQADLRPVFERADFLVWENQALGEKTP